MNYDLNAHLEPVYSRFPEATTRPIIGITSNFMNDDACLRKFYYEQVAAAGATPIIIPPIRNTDIILNTLAQLDALLLSGGGDINPLWSGEEPIRELHNINSERDLPELLITRLAFNQQIPILGICRGMQTLVTALGGKVTQDIYISHLPETTQTPDRPSYTSPQNIQRPATIKHSQDAPANESTHSVKLEKGSIIHSIYKTEKIFVNSFHHQAVSFPGEKFRTTATAPDGVIEAIESNEFKNILGVQWHPERMQREGQPIFRWLATQAANFNEVKQLHKRMLTLDTHCDTPMFFPQGVKFNCRESKTLYDLHKMTDGLQDAVTMAAYLPQPKLGESFSSKIDIIGLKRNNPELGDILDNISPARYANLVFDKIEKIVKDNQKYVSIARTPADLYEDKRKGRKSIMFAIENGLALEHNLSNVKQFAQRGVTYITLCHNGDNDICDSARGSNMHGGLSTFGREVVSEMNRNGILVDLSHGAESSFYDALELSSQPIVCSHSNCKALCNHPRNLSDDQLRALAKKGGVAHTTLYKGFLTASEATILDVLAHLEHAIKIMGIDHVGIGTDFDGDGTVRGMSDASEMLNFTLLLLKRRFNPRDIEKIWGGNWLRVMSQVQSVRNK